jgi:hypothetical protein
MADSSTSIVPRRRSSSEARRASVDAFKRANESRTDNRYARRRNLAERVEAAGRERVDHRVPGHVKRIPPRDVSYAKRWVVVPRGDFAAIDRAIREAHKARKAGIASAERRADAERRLAALEDASKLLGRWRQRAGRRGGMSVRQARRLANQRKRLETERKALRRVLGLVGQGKTPAPTAKTWTIPQAFVNELEDAITQAERAADLARYQAGMRRLRPSERASQSVRGEELDTLRAWLAVQEFRTPEARRDAESRPISAAYPTMKRALTGLEPRRARLVAYARRPRDLLRDREVRGPDGPGQLSDWLPDAVRRAKLAAERLERLRSAPALDALQVEGEALILARAIEGFRRRHAGKPRHAADMRHMFDGLRIVRPRLHALRQRAIAARRAGNGWADDADLERWAELQRRLTHHARRLRAMSSAKLTDHRRGRAPVDAETWTTLRDAQLEETIRWTVAPRSRVTT